MTARWPYSTEPYHHVLEAVWRDKSLNADERLVLTYLAMHCTRQSCRCWIKRNAAEEIGIPDETFSRCLLGLESQEKITVRRNLGRITEVVITPPDLWSPRRPGCWWWIGRDAQ